MITLNILQHIWPLTFSSISSIHWSSFTSTTWSLKCKHIALKHFQVPGVQRAAGGIGEAGTYVQDVSKCLVHLLLLVLRLCSCPYWGRMDAGFLRPCSQRPRFPAHSQLRLHVIQLSLTPPRALTIGRLLMDALIQVLFLYLFTYFKDLKKKNLEKQGRSWGLLHSLVCVSSVILTLL